MNFCMSNKDFHIFWDMMGWDPISVGDLIISGGFIYKQLLGQICIYGAQFGGTPV